MAIGILPRTVDVGNLVIAKGSNFLLTVLLFALLSQGMDSHAFGEFGYWWSIGIMIGGILLGGLLSALVRTAAVHGSLRHLTAPLRHTGLALLALVLGIALGALALPDWTGMALLLVAVLLFGLAVQAQTAVLALLRAAEAIRANALASLLIVLLVPLALHLMLGADRTLPGIFFYLACAFVLGTAAALACGHSRLRPLFAPTSSISPGVRGFLANTSSFTAINFFSYAIVNLDFTLFRLIGSPQDFAVMATGKVFFERFVLPALMVFAGAVSLRVLRHPSGQGSPLARLEARFSPRMFAAAIAAVVLLVLAYWVFAHAIRGDAATIPSVWIACAALGYLLYAANGILLDVLVVRRSLTAVSAHVIAFLLFGMVVQILAIGGFGVPGWAVGWLLFNAVVAVTLAREGLRLHLSGWSEAG